MFINSCIALFINGVYLAFINTPDIEHVIPGESRGEEVDDEYRKRP